MIPDHLLRDRYWKAMLYLFSNHPKLERYFTAQYFDLESGTVRAAALKKAAAPWSESEKFVLNLALHCFNEIHKVNLSDMDYLDQQSKQLAFEAIKLRFG
ncbi:hypothetical protein [Paenibacillus sp. IITD108]|uniref:hypothetical protein n=1 Tax=Paenibacillus sp. IITD108 TaxID=3116649 RepID=UPI002F41D00C